MSAQILKCGTRQLDLSHTHVMGVLNVTPDSFSDGGNFHTLDAALSQAESMLIAGASIIDVGGESTRPGASPVSLQEEMDRVCPVVERISKELDVIVSVDTSSPELMKSVVDLGCGMLNDVRAFAREGAFEAITGADVALCAMHMQGQPGYMQNAPKYDDPVAEVLGFLKLVAKELNERGFSPERLVLDPGFGFGKSLTHNLDLLASISKICETGYPVLVGMSRKSMIGAILNKDVDERLYGSVAAAVIAAQNGARIVRVHDVAETVDALKVVDAVRLGISQN